MFKGTGENLDHVKRVGSASTRERPSGRMDMIPEGAREPEEYYNSLRVQLEQSIATVADIQNKLGGIRERLKTTWPRKVYEHLIAERERLALLVVEHQAKTTQLRNMAREAAKRSWYNLFHECARQLLDHETYKKIQGQCTELIGRSPTDGIERSQQSFSAEYRHHQTRRKNFNRSLEKLRDKQGDGKSLVYSTEIKDGQYFKVKDRERGQS
jgi:hypothetical protein